MRLCMKRAAAFICCLLAVLLLFPTKVSARVRIDLTQKCSLSLQYRSSGVEFSLFRIADISEIGDYTIVGDFADSKYSFTLEQKDQSGWSSLAGTLASYAAADKLTPLEKMSTDENGKLTFATDKPGLYLVTWNAHVEGDYTYIPQPFIVSLPNLDSEDNWLYDVTTEPKYTSVKNYNDVTIVVHKVWNDNGNTAKRPANVTVELLENGNLWESVVLSEENNWKYTWEKLDERKYWQVVERNVPAGYTVQITQEGNTFIVTNTAPETPNILNIPQTGMLWWPVPLLAMGGLLLVCVGYILKRRSSENED